MEKIYKVNINKKVNIVILVWGKIDIVVKGIKRDLESIYLTIKSLML